MKDHVDLEIGPKSLRYNSVFYTGMVVGFAVLAAPWTYLVMRVAPQTATADEIAVFLVVWGTVYLVANRLLLAFISNAEVDNIFAEMLAEVRAAKDNPLRLTAMALTMVLGVAVALGSTIAVSVPIYRWLDISWAAEKAWAVAGVSALVVLAVAASCLIAAFVMPRGPYRPSRMKRLMARLAVRADALGFVFFSIRSHSNRSRAPSTRV